MKRIVASLCLLLFMAFFIPIGVKAAEPVSLVIQGLKVEPDVPPVIHNQRTMVPVRVVAEGLNAIVEWDQKTKTATITKENREIQLQLNNPVASIDGENVELDAPPFLQNNRMLLPMRFVGEALGITVGWESNTRTVYANHPFSVEANGEDVTGKVKGYVMDGQYYISVQDIARLIYLDYEWDQEQKKMVIKKKDRSFSIKADEPILVDRSDRKRSAITKSSKSNNRIGEEVAKEIDSSLVITMDQLQEILDDEVINWTIEPEPQLVVERLRTLEKIEAIDREDETSVFLRTSEPVEPEHFRLVGPHRIVLDLPAANLSGELLDFLNQQQVLQDQELALTEDEGKRKTTNDPVEEADLSETGDQLPEKGVSPENEEENAVDDTESEEDIPDIASFDAESGLIIQDDNPYPVIREIRYSQYDQSPYTVRVVLELNRKSDYEIIPHKNGLEIKLNPLPPKTGYLIIVDAGHGGKDPGARGTAGNVEKDFNLKVSMLMVEMLSEYEEFQVMATRSDDTFLTLQERVELANDMDADLFISIHANAYVPGTRGTETYYYNRQSEAFARVIHKYLVEATQFPNRGVQTAPFYVIKNTTMPAVLTETGFLTHPEENAKLMQPDFQEKVARALVNGIREYYENYE